MKPLHVRQLEQSLELAGALDESVVVLRVPQLVDEDPENRHQPQQGNADQFGGRARLGEQPDRDARDRRHEGEHLRSEVGERLNEFRCLVVVELQRLVGLHLRLHAVGLGERLLRVGE